jgi:hypothetical protein
MEVIGLHVLFAVGPRLVLLLQLVLRQRLNSAAAVRTAAWDALRNFHNENVLADNSLRRARAASGGCLWRTAA